MKRRYFGTDGIRGKVGEAPITPEFVLRLGYAAGKVLAGAVEPAPHAPGRRGRPTVLIGKDTRVSGYMLEAALEAGFSAAGVDVMLAGPMPTPGVAYLTRALRLSAGVVISASHNPYDDNGIKFFSADGNKLPDELEQRIEAALDVPLVCAPSEHLGKARRLDDAAGRYIEFCKSTFPAAFDLRGLKLVVDCAHGAAYQIAPHVFHELGADVAPIGVQPNGFNINDGVGATAPAALIEAVRIAIQRDAQVCVVFHHRRRQGFGRGGAKAGVDVEAVRRGADRDYFGAQLVEHVRRDRVGGAVGAVDHDLQAAQVQLVREGALAEFDVAASRIV